MIGTQECPACKGVGRIVMHLNRGVWSHSWEERDCSTCDGSGLISREHAERIVEGERRREDRKSRNLSLRDEAARLGITPQALSAIENGRRH